jgi:hypothetical protein
MRETDTRLTASLANGFIPEVGERRAQQHAIA